MFMLLLLVVATILLLACLGLAIFAAFRLRWELSRRDYSEASFTSMVMVAAGLIAAVQYQAIRQIVPQISVW